MEISKLGVSILDHC